MYTETAITVGELTQMISAFDPPGCGLEPVNALSHMESDVIPFYAPDTYVHWGSTSELWRAFIFDTYPDWLSGTRGTLGFVDYLGLIDLRLHQEFHHPVLEFWPPNGCVISLRHELRNVLIQLPQETLIKNSFLPYQMNNLFHYWHSLPNPYFVPPNPWLDAPNPWLEDVFDLSVEGAAFLEVMQYVV